MIHQEIALLKELKKNNPWSGGYKAKKKKFKWLLTELCLIHNLKVPKLIIPQYPQKLKWTKKICGDCSRKTIRINNFSVLTLLHEFKHWIDFHNPNLEWKQKKEKEKREYDAYYYSTRRFYEIWPERINMLSEFYNLIDNDTEKSIIAIDKIRKMKYQYQKTNIDYKLRAETCAIIDIILKEVWC